MKQKILILLGFIFFILLVLFIFKIIGGSGPKQGELRVDSDTAANVFLDNRPIGKTPYKEKTATGEYTVRIAPDSNIQQLAPWEGKITIGKNLLTYISASLSDSELTSAVDVLWLEKISGNKAELSVSTTPDGATVLVDDANKGVTPVTIQDIPSGDHTITITSAGYMSRAVKIRVTPGFKLLASIKLALSASPVTEFEASASPTPIVSTGPTGKTTPTPTGKAGTVNQTDPARPFVVIKDTPTGFLRVRSEPSTAATEAAQVKPGEKFSYTETKADAKGTNWYQIKYSGLSTGWVSGQYVNVNE